MNADEIVPGLARPPRREDYEPIVKGLRPFCEGEELECRTALLLMRDRAIATKSHGKACETAWALLDIVEREAARAALDARYSLENLSELRRLCVRCVTCASGFDQLYPPPAPDEEKAVEHGG